MKQYQQTVWFTRSTNMAIQSASHNISVLINTISRIQTNKIILDKTNNIFNYNTTKREDSFILDFVHGSSFLFGNCRKTVLDEDSDCYFCAISTDSPEHQLLHCSELAEYTQQQLLKHLSSQSHYIEEIIAPMKQEIQKAFIDRVRFLIVQHDINHEQAIQQLQANM